MIDINNESEHTVDELALVQLSKFALNELRIHPQAELSLVLVTPEVMADYHERFMGLEGPTDVMSFPMDELRVPSADEEPPEGLLGDIVLCPALIEEQAPQNGRSFEDELHYLLLHGLLHLLGFDHAEEGEKAVMFALTDGLQAAWKKSRPTPVTQPSKPLAEPTGPIDEADAASNQPEGSR